MSDQRKEPDLGRYEDLAGTDRIPTLTDIATRGSTTPDQGKHDEAASHAFAPLESKEPGAQSASPELFEDLPEFSLPDEETGSLDPADYDFIDELTQPAEPEPTQPATQAAPDPVPDSPSFSGDELEALADRILDQIAPALREAITAAIETLIRTRNNTRD